METDSFRYRIEFNSVNDNGNGKKIEKNWNEIETEKLTTETE